MIYVFNSPVLTSYGQWSYEGPLTIEQARALLSTGFASAIGHSGAAQYLTLLLGVEIPTNRVAVTMQGSDRALVLRMLQRMPEGAILAAEDLLKIPCELSLLTKLG